ncbi:MAG: hypothetical protein V3R30_07555 [Kiloniellales bacterium]
MTIPFTDLPLFHHAAPLTVRCSSQITAFRLWVPTSTPANVRTRV